MKTLAPCQETVIAIVTRGPLCSTGQETHQTSASLSMALTVMTACPAAPPVLHCLFVLGENKTAAELRARSRRALLRLVRCLRFRCRDGPVSQAPRSRVHCGRRAAVSQDAVCPPPGRAAPQVLLPLPALQLSREGCELLTAVLAQSLQEARSAVSRGPRRIIIV